MSGSGLTEAHFAAIPRRNLRVPREEFIAVWIEAERLDREMGRGGLPQWYPAGVAVTCR